MPLSLYSDLVTYNTYNNQTNQLIVTKACVVTNDKDLLMYMINLVNSVTVNIFLNNILTISIILFVLKSRKKFAKSTKNSSVAVKDRKFAINSIALNLASISCRSPFIIAMVVSTYLHVDGEIVGMFFAIGVAIYTIECSSAFFINYFVNSIFKSEFRGLLGNGRFILSSKAFQSISQTNLSAKESKRC